MPIVDYTEPSLVIPGYKCGDCRRGRVKLWRFKDVAADHQKLLCVDCVCREIGMDSGLVRPDGTYVMREGTIAKTTYQLGGVTVPALPHAYRQNRGAVIYVDFWMYGPHLPEDAWQWWQGQPLRR